MAADERLTQLTAAEASRLIQRRELSPVALVQALLDRVAATEPALHAWTALDAEGALAAARRAEQQSWSGPLHGIAFGAKDIYWTADLPTGALFEPFRDYRAPRDAEAVARLKAAGAVLLGKTATTQFALADPAPTTNPWNLGRTPGGSSSGSAASVAARQVPLALGTQTAGSVIRPAAFCGIVGFKPSFGRVSRRGIFPLAWTLDHAGVLCRSVEDASLWLGAVQGHDPNDPFSASAAPVDVAAAHLTPGGAPTLGLVRDFVDRAEPEVRDHLLQVASRLEAMGADIREVVLPVELDQLLATQFIILRSETAALHAHLLHQQGEHYGPRLKSAVQAGQLIPAAAYLHALRLRRRYAQATKQLLAEVQALLLPSVGCVPPNRSGTGESSFQAPWSMFGWPAIS
ncbi:MAG: amidase, partial [Chloroflexota bacterium]